MKIYALLFLIFFGFFSLSAQERFVKPIDEASKDASFLAFRTKLVEAVRRRDAQYVLNITDRNIQIGFGGDNGIEEFKRFWKINRSNSKFWNEFLTVITNGGKFEKGNAKLFYAPYSFNSFPEDLDSFEYSMIFGSNVNLRERADLKSKTVARLSYNIVKVDFDDSVKDKTNKDKYLWLKVKTLGGKSGFVNADFVRSPLDYRAAFEKRGGKWKMTAFLAGD